VINPPKLSSSSVASLVAVTGVWIYLYYLNIIQKGVIVDFADGVAHFDVSRSALENPKNLFDNWARPVHVLFSLVPAQFGFKVYIFCHVLLMVVNSYLVMLLGVRWNLVLPWLLPWWMLLSTAVIHATLGGLTEPLFISLSLFTLVLLDAKRWFALGIVLGASLVARHEALLLILVVFFFMLHNEALRNAWKCLIGLSLIVLIVSLLGVFWGEKTTLFWIIMDQPYGRNPNIYGSGTWTHFWDNRRLWASKVMIGAFGISALVALTRVLLIKQLNASLVPFIIASGTIIAHAILWKFGLMGSLGLTRIMSIAVPFIALGIHTLNFKGGILVLSLFLGHAYQWNRDAPDLEYSKSVQQIVSETDLDGLANVSPSTRIAAQWRLPLVLKGIATEDSKRTVKLWELPPLLPSSGLNVGDLLVWDNVTGFREGGIDLSICRRDAGLLLIDSVEHYGVKLVVFRVVPSEDEVLLETTNLASNLSGFGIWTANKEGELLIRSPKKYARIVQLKQNSPSIRVKWKGSPSGQLVIRSHDGSERVMGSEGTLLFKRISSSKMLLWRAEDGEALQYFQAIKA